MKSLLKKITAVLLISILAVSCIACGKSNKEPVADIQVEEDVTLNLWYTDDKMTPYLTDVINKYHEKNPHVTVQLQLAGADEYLENIYNASTKDGNAADVYMLSSDNLEKAYLMGLTAENDTYSSSYTEEVYGKAGIEAATYQNKLLGYPLSFETTVMVYNKKYATPMSTFADITSYSNAFEHTDENAEVSSIIKWDVSDVFTNYALVGAYMNIGGKSSDDTKDIQISGDGFKACMNEFVKFKTDYGIVRKTTTAEECINQFSQNKVLYTFAKTSDLKKINDAGVQYGISKIPDLTSSLKTNTLSMTQLVMVNPYTGRQNVAKSVANAISYEYADELYGLTGLTSARCNLDNYPTEEYGNLYRIYADSVVKAQFMKIGDFYLKLEILFHQVWDGTASVEEGYNTFNSYVSTIQNGESWTK